MRKRTQHVKFTRLNKMADDIEKITTTRLLDFGDLVGKDLAEEEASKEFQQTLRRIASSIDDLKESARKDELDYVLAPLLEKADGDATILQELVLNMMNNKGNNNSNNIEKPAHQNQNNVNEKNSNESI